MKLRINDITQKCQADPYMFENDGSFYIFTTGVDGVKCYQSNELLGEYRYLGDVYKRDGIFK